jgi:class 3 adenylate cyclase
MDAKWQSYDFKASFQRVQDILNQSDINYVETDSLPSRDKLTFTNGFYAKASALVVDIRGSSDLPRKYKRPTLARIYRAFLSEMVAIMNNDANCREVNIVGDSVWSVVNTPKKSNIDVVFSSAARANSLVKVLNYRLTKKGLSEIRVGIGMSWGRTLMIKAGHGGSGINDVVYMGDVVNEASKLASYGNATYSDVAMMVSGDFRFNLSEHNRGLLSWNSTRNCWQGNVVNVAMEAWYDENCK